MRLTRFGFHGLLFYGVMLAAFYASPYSNLFFLLLAFLTLLFASGVLAALRNLRGVTPALASLEPVPSGASVRVPLILAAPRRARFQLGARLELERGGVLTGQLDLLEGRGTLALHAPALPRGCHRVRALVLESSHPFGLVRARARHVAGLPAELVVHPAPCTHLEGRSAQTLDDLLGASLPAAGDLQPTSLRDHREGEGIRGVHWRASARRGRLVVQEWEGGSGLGLEVLLDRRADEPALEEALATISAMAEVARTKKETLRVSSQGLAATFGEEQRPWLELLRFLAEARALPADGPAPPPVSPSVARLPLPASPAHAHVR